jgi:hypothetical protein
MRPTTLVILALATLVFAVGAVVVNSRNPAYSRASGGDLVFPDLAGKINDAAKIVVKTASGTFTVARLGKGWGVAEKHDYPAKYETVKSTLVGLTQLKTVEAKTAEPLLYPRLEVEDPGAKGAKSELLTVEDAKGEALARLIIGKSRYGRGGEDVNMVYVRKPDDAQSWLAEGPLERQDDVKAWLQREIVNLPRDQVRQVTVTPAAANDASDKGFVVAKEEPGSGDFALQGVPPEDKVKSSYDVNAIGGELASLMFDDVMPASALKPEAKPLRTLEYRSFDGLVVTLALYKQDNKTWTKIDARYDAGAAAPGPAAPAAPVKEPAPAASGAGTAATGGAGEKAKPAEKPGEGAPAAKKQAEDIVARTKDWVYLLGPGDLSAIEKKFAELVEPKEKPKS